MNRARLDLNLVFKKKNEFGRFRQFERMYPRGVRFVLPGVKTNLTLYFRENVCGITAVV